MRASGTQRRRIRQGQNQRPAYADLRLLPAALAAFTAAFLAIHVDAAAATMVANLVGVGCLLVFCLGMCHKSRLRRNRAALGVVRLEPILVQLLFASALAVLVLVVSAAGWQRIPAAWGPAMAEHQPVVAAGALCGFVVLVGPDPSVLRAAIMAGAGVLAVFGGRRSRGGPTLCLAVIVMLLGDPWLAADAGFQLSVTATTGLLILARPLREVLVRWLPDWLAVAIAAPLAAQLFCAPLLVMLQPQLTLYALPANLLASPVIPLITALGILTVPAIALCPPLVAALLWPAGLGSAWIAHIAAVTAALPGAGLPWPEGHGGALLATIPGLLSCLVIYRLSGRWDNLLPGPLLRVLAGPLAGLLSLLGLVAGVWLGYLLGSAGMRVFSGLPS